MGPYNIYHSKTEKTKTFLHDFVKNINKLSYKNTLMGPLIFINYKIK